MRFKLLSVLGIVVLGVFVFNCGMEGLPFEENQPSEKKIEDLSSSKKAMQWTSNDDPSLFARAVSPHQ